MCGYLQGSHRLLREVKSPSSSSFEIFYAFACQHNDCSIYSCRSCQIQTVCCSLRKNRSENSWPKSKKEKQNDSVQRLVIIVGNALDVEGDC